ncbi:hypothetical protein [Natrinema halophilum]|uniref:DUF7981 domain-containing protein n=1 Tax=Natrinema halophilum TaxID=1699371 RepID=A0A7D5GS87_9EURY|nr:hypothetical protein [Natrinema halophilum]QLG49089.1 hypothetical protein HYG82_09615 [Natrinema halophilum]
MSGHPAEKRGIDSRTRSAVLWGIVGFLSFLVLLQGYALVDEPIVSIGWGLVIASLVGFGSLVGSYLLEPRIAAWSNCRNGK